MLFKIIFRLLGVAALAAVVISLGRPAWLYGISGDPLAYSLARHAGGTELLDENSCVPAVGDIWTCAILDERGTGSAAYRLRVDGNGCWEGERITATGFLGNLETQPSACLSIRDYIRLAEVGN